MKCLSLFSEKNIINLSSAEFAQQVARVNKSHLLASIPGHHDFVSKGL